MSTPNYVLSDRAAQLLDMVRRLCGERVHVQVFGLAAALAVSRRARCIDREDVRQALTHYAEGQGEG